MNKMSDDQPETIKAQTVSSKVNADERSLKQELNQLEETMHDADQFHTLEEQVADMKRRGIDPKKSYKDWDDNKDDDWGDKNWKENGKWEHKTPADLDKKAQGNWGDDNDDLNPPPIV